MSGRSVEAVTFDFFDTLVEHRDGRGRGAVLVEYLERQGLAHGPWEHQILYDVFDRHDAEYDPGAPAQERQAYVTSVVARLFARLGIAAGRDAVEEHADRLWTILGPSAFRVFSDVGETLGRLRVSGIRTAVISNWQSGLRHFCTELGLVHHFEHILGSADVGAAKPDEQIFREACARLAVPPERVLHVGDTYIDDYRGASEAGLRAVLLERPPRSGARRRGDPPVAVRRVRTLGEVVGLVSS